MSILIFSDVIDNSISLGKTGSLYDEINDILLGLYKDYGICYLSEKDFVLNKEFSVLLSYLENILEIKVVKLNNNLTKSTGIQQVYKEKIIYLDLHKEFDSKVYIFLTLYNMLRITQKRKKEIYIYNSGTITASYSAPLLSYLRWLFKSESIKDKIFSLKNLTNQITIFRKNRRLKGYPTESEIQESLEELLQKKFILYKKVNNEKLRVKLTHKGFVMNL